MNWDTNSDDHSGETLFVKDPYELSEMSHSRCDPTYGLSSQSQDLICEFLKAIQNERPAQSKLFEDIVRSFISDLHIYKSDISRLEMAYKSEKEKNEETIRQMIEEAEQQLAQVGDKIKEQQKQESEKIQEKMKNEYESQIKSLKEKLANMQDFEKKFQETKNNGEFIVGDLKTTLENLNSENSQLKKALRESKSEVSVLRSEIAELKSMDGDSYSKLSFNDWTSEIKQLKNEIDVLQTANKKLNDANDLLRNELDFFKQKTPRDDLPISLITSGRQKSSQSTSQFNDFSIDEDIESGYEPSSNATELSDFQYETDNSLFFPQNFNDETLKVESNPVPKSTQTMTCSDKEGPIIERVFKVVFSGDSAVGKTSFIMRYCKGTFYESLSSTLGIDFHTKNVELDGKNISIQLVDTCGQERFRSLSKSYFRRAEGAVLLYDCTCESSFASVKEWINIINDTTDKKIPIVIVANKIDLREDARKAPNSRVIEREEGVKLATEFDCLFVEASAKDGTNMEESLLELCRKMTVNADPESEPKSEVIKLTPDAPTVVPAKKKGRCC